MTNEETKQYLIALAEKYECRDFIIGDPSWYMHQVSGERNQETMALIASCLSYGSRKQFMPKIAIMAEHSGGDIYQWVKDCAYRDLISDNDHCYYRLYTNRMMLDLLDALREMIVSHGSIGAFVAGKGDASLACKGAFVADKVDAYSAIDAICRYFMSHGSQGIIPKDTSSACKRICMFLRWMVRDNSPVDLGLWSQIIDKRTLIMPLDTHVIQQARRLMLINSTTASMSTARRLTKTMLEVFPNDPLKGDFALFGYGVNAEREISL